MNFHANENGNANGNGICKHCVYAGWDGRGWGAGLSIMQLLHNAFRLGQCVEVQAIND